MTGKCHVFHGTLEQPWLPDAVIIRYPDRDELHDAADITFKENIIAAPRSILGSQNQEMMIYQVAMGDGPSDLADLARLKILKRSSDPYRILIMSSSAAEKLILPEKATGCRRHGDPKELFWFRGEKLQKSFHWKTGPTFYPWEDGVTTSPPL